MICKQFESGPIITIGAVGLYSGLTPQGISTGWIMGYKTLRQHKLQLYTTVRC